MSRANQGGSAFPQPSGGYPGMSLRDWFAGMAMQGLLAAPHRDEWDFEKVVSLLPRVSYAIADAMITERKKP